MLPTKRGDMGEQVVRHILDLAQGGNRALEIPCVPEDDRGDDEIQAGGAVLLVLVGSVADFAEPVDEHRPCQAVAGLALVELLAGLAAQFRVFQPVEGEEGALQPAQFAQRGGDAVLPGMGGQLAQNQGGCHRAGAQRGGDPQNLRPMVPDQGDVDSGGDQRFERRIGFWLFEAVEASVLQIGNTWCEAKAEQGAESEHVVRDTSAIGVVAAGRDLGLVMKQCIQHIRGLAGGRRHQLGVEGGIAIGDVGIEFNSWLMTVMRVNVGGIPAGTAGPKELAVGRRRKATTEDCRERLSLLVIDQALECKIIGLVSNMPIGGPGDMAGTGNGASFGDARQSKIEPVGEDAGQEDLRIGDGFAGPQVGKAVGEARPARHLRQQIGDPDARQHGVETHRQSLGLGRSRPDDRGDLQHALVDRHIRQQATFGLGVDRDQPLIQGDAAARDEAVEVGVHHDRQGLAPLQLLQRLARDEALFKGAVLPAARHPDVTGAQPVTEFRQHAEFVIAPVERRLPTHAASSGAG